MREFVYNFTGKPIKKVFQPGNYLVECWGAEGGMGCYNGELQRHGGRGAYCGGVLTLNRVTTLYIYVGGKGNNAVCTKNVCINQEGGFNGGGKGGCDPQDDDDAGSGGGASDIRLISDEDNDRNMSLRSRIIVAAGGSGSVLHTYGSPGGDLTGFLPIKSQTEEYKKSDTNQTNGIFGVGANGENCNLVPSSGGGGGYYGGISLGPQTIVSDYFKAVSSSGSSFISGFPGCNAVKDVNDSSPSGSEIHYSQLVFKKGVMINGYSSMPKPFSNDFQIGNGGNGVIIITMFPRVFSFFCKKTGIFPLNILFFLAMIIK